MLSQRFQTVTTLENTKHGRLSTIRLRRSPRDPLVDLLFASTGIEAEVVAAAEPIDSTEWRRAARAVGMIERRGFARGRDLGRALTRLRG